MSDDGFVVGRWDGCGHVLTRPEMDAARYGLGNSGRALGHRHPVLAAARAKGRRYHQHITVITPPSSYGPGCLPAEREREREREREESPSTLGEYFDRRVSLEWGLRNIIAVRGHL